MVAYCYIESYPSIVLVSKLQPAGTMFALERLDIFVTITKYYNLQYNDNVVMDITTKEGTRPCLILSTFSSLHVMYLSFYDSIFGLLDGTNIDLLPNFLCHDYRDSFCRIYFIHI